METDVEGGHVIMRYERDGQMVVEQWRIAERRCQW